MRETVTLTGMVLISAPSGDYDRRLVLLHKGAGTYYCVCPWSQKTRQSPDGIQQAFFLWDIHTV